MEKKKYGKVSLLEKVIYGSGDVGLNVMYTLFSSYVMFFYTDVIMVNAAVSGRKYKRVGIVAAQCGKEIISPLTYAGTMDSSLFEYWFEKQLLPALPPGAVIVMDNASFHRKAQLTCVAHKYGFRLIFLPPYSPEFNPIENFWAWLKRFLRSFLAFYNSFDHALFDAFQGG